MSLSVYLENNRCEHCGRSDEGFCQNITHNLAPMASESEIYQIVWRPKENGITKAGQLIGQLRRAIAEMKAEPERFRKHNPRNGWGDYGGFVKWLEKYLAACEAMPDAAVVVIK